MKYRIFDTQQAAIDAEAIIAQSLGLPKVGINAQTGRECLDAQITTRWAIPQQIPDGRWVFPSPDDIGEEAADDWFPSDPLG